MKLAVEVVAFELVEVEDPQPANSDPRECLCDYRAYAAGADYTDAQPPQICLSRSAPGSSPADCTLSLLRRPNLAVCGNS